MIISLSKKDISFFNWFQMSFKAENKKRMKKIYLRPKTGIQIEDQQRKRIEKNFQ